MTNSEREEMRTGLPRLLGTFMDMLDDQALTYDPDQVRRIASGQTVECQQLQSLNGDRVRFCISVELVRFRDGGQADPAPWKRPHA